MTSRRIRRQLADRAPGWRWHRWHDPDLAELAAIADTVGAVMATRDEVPRHLLRRARGGELTRANTAPGTPERAAVYQSEYRRRVEHAGRRGLTRRQARGHPGRGEIGVLWRTAEFFSVPTTEGMLDLVGLNSRESSQIGRYLRDVRELADIDRPLYPATFRRRWRGKGVGDVRFESDPNRVLAMLRESGPGPVDRYRRNPGGGVR